MGISDFYCGFPLAITTLVLIRQKEIPEKQSWLQAA
jgi:hypothetical protein